MNVDLEIQTNDSPSLMLDMKIDNSSSLALDIESEQPLKLTADGAMYILSMSDYRKLINKPSIEGVELYDDKSFEELGLAGSNNVTVSHGKIDVSEITSAQLTAILTDD